MLFRALLLALSFLLVAPQTMAFQEINVGETEEGIELIAWEVNHREHTPADVSPAAVRNPVHAVAIAAVPDKSVVTVPHKLFIRFRKLLI